MIRRLLFSAFLVLVAGPLRALDPGPIAAQTVAEWSAWMERHGISEGALVVTFDGEVVAEHGIARTPDDPAKVASLSKAITAVCALRAADVGGAKVRTPLAEAMADELAKHPPRDTTMADVTIGQLITHTSGIHSEYHRTNIEKLRTFSKENKSWQFSKIAADRMGQAPGDAGYHYSNANYLALGLIVEQLTGEDYEEFCTREILAPIGVTTARLNDTWTVMSSWGGWEVSARDYLRFAEHYFRGESGPSRPGGYFVPAASVGRGAFYGAGVFYRTTAAGYNVWHLGSWRWKGRLNDQFGAYFALYDNGFSVSTNYAHHAYRGAIREELEDLLWRTTHP